MNQWLLKLGALAASGGFLLIAVARSAADESFVLEPVLQARLADGSERLINQSRRHVHRIQEDTISTAFVAIVTTLWPADLVPLFAVETSDSFELRRLPPRGQENYTEPLFFALPADHETNTFKVTGKWNAVAANSQRSNHMPNWELAIDGERVAGRFDPQGEYRVAFITGGFFRTNRLELSVEYINDHYVLEGEWRDGALSGTWRQLEEAQKGTWQATRPSSLPKSPSAAGSVPLFEWRRGKARRYSVTTNLNEPGWERARHPTCRVWKQAPAL